MLLCLSEIIKDVQNLLDFEKMIKNKKYLFDKLKPILEEKNIGFDLFSDVYNEVSLSSRSIK